MIQLLSAFLRFSNRRQLVTVFLNWTNAATPVHYRCKKEVDRTGKKYVYFIRWNTLSAELYSKHFISSRVKNQRYHGDIKSCLCPSSEDYKKNIFQRNCLFAALTREIFSTLEEKFRVSARPCNNSLCIYFLFCAKHRPILYCSSLFQYMRICPSYIGNNSAKFINCIQGISP